MNHLKYTAFNPSAAQWLYFNFYLLFSGELCDVLDFLSLQINCVTHTATGLSTLPMTSLTKMSPFGASAGFFMKAAPRSAIMTVGVAV